MDEQIWKLDKLFGIDVEPITFFNLYMKLNAKKQKLTVGHNIFSQLLFNNYWLPKMFMQSTKSHSPIENCPFGKFLAQLFKMQNLVCFLVKYCALDPGLYASMPMSMI